MSDKCPQCRRPRRPHTINLCDMRKSCRATGDAECVEAQRNALRLAMAEIADITSCCSMEDSGVGRVSRIALDATGRRDMKVAEAMMRERQEGVLA